MKRKRIIYLSVTALVLIIIFFVFRSLTATDKSQVFTPVKKGLFEINVFTTGELSAKNSIEIMGPSSMRSVGIWQVKIDDLVPEGTVVKKGEYVAALDKTEIMNRIKDEENNLSKAESQFTQSRLDTTLTLRQARDELVNMKYEVTAKQIILEQSKYEPPATIRQATIDQEKAQRSLEQAQENYFIKENQAKAKMQEVTAVLNLAKNKLDMLQVAMGQFTITAPESGMVIYDRNWNGEKKIVGSTVNAWEPTVATLPDLTTMLSKTYVNEVDIRKIKKGQTVNITLDAFPEKKLTGTVTDVANVGEQSPKTDSKVFEVSIQINEKDTTLRPAMTTGNNIIAGKYDDVLFIPLESVRNDGDSASYVFVKQSFGLKRKDIKVGLTNDNFAQVLSGIEADEMILLSSPPEEGKKDEGKLADNKPK